MTSHWAAMPMSMNSTRMPRRHCLICIQLQPIQEIIFSPMRCMLINKLKSVTPLIKCKSHAMAVWMTSTCMRRRRIPWSAFSYNQCQENIFSTMRCTLINTLRPVTPLTTCQSHALAVWMTSTCMRRRRIPWYAFSYSQCRENIFSSLRCMSINTFRHVTPLTTRLWAAMAVWMPSIRKWRRRIP